MNAVTDSSLAASREPTRTIAWDWLTVEVGAYAALVAVGLVFRLLWLGAWPLAADELAPALSALRAVRGESWRAVYYSPLIFDLNLAQFALTRATDATVRLFPSLVGAALVAMPYLFRRRLGRAGALAVAALAAISPIGIYLSRSGDGAVLALGCSVLALAAVEHGRPRWLVVAVALGVLTAPLFYTLPMGMAVAVLVSLGTRRTLPGLERFRETLRGVLRRDLALGGALLVLGATAATANLAGIGATAEVAWRWFADLAPRSAEGAWWWLITNLAFYEPVTLALALVACGYAIRARDSALWERAVALWLAWALFLGTLGGHRGTLWIGQAWLPAIILAGRGVERLIGAFRQGERDARDTVGVAVTLVALCFAWLELVAYQQTGQRIRLSLMVWGVGAGIVLLWGLGLWCGARRALCAAACALALWGGAVHLSSASALAYRTARDPREPLHTRIASADVRELEALVDRAATKGGKDRTTLRVVYDRELDEVLGWALRDYPWARAASDPLREEADVWITRELPEEAWPARLAGQPVALWESLALHELASLERLRWVVTRLPVGASTRERAHVWLPLDLADRSP